MSQNVVVLIVDDEESLCELMADLLSDRYQVYKAFNGKQALELVQQHQPALIISDIMMPQMTGVDLLRAVKGQAETSEVPVILVSAVKPAQTEDLLEAAAFVNKPFEIDMLESIVEETLAKVNTPHLSRQLNESGQMVTRSHSENNRGPGYNFDRNQKQTEHATYLNQPSDRLLD